METTAATPRDRTGVTWALFLARLVLATIFMAHGSQKVFGLFGGHGYLTGLVKAVGPLGYLVATAEFFGGLALLLGLFSRFSAFWLIVVMANAIALVHGKNGFFLGKKLGFEYEFALLGLLAVILLAGPGRLSLSHLLPLPPRLRAWLS